MIYLVTLQSKDSATRGMMRALRPLASYLRCTSYERIFRDQRLRLGHYVFADLDMLERYEREVLVSAVDALRSVDPHVRILNDPRYVLERYPLLRALQREGINRFEVTRLDGGDEPTRYPVFLRCEDDHQGVDTGLLHDQTEFRAALQTLRTQGKSLKRRIAVEFCAEPDVDGLYRKYGAFVIGDDVIPYHVFIGEHWFLKSRTRRAKLAHDQDEELDFIKANPHADQISPIFKLAGIDFGRMDYTVIDGRVQVYEINTNPKLPRFTRGKREDTVTRKERRELTKQRFVQALDAIDKRPLERRWVDFEMPEPRFEVRRWRTWRRRALSTFLSTYPSAKVAVPRRYW